MTDPVKVIDLKTSARAKILVAEDENDIASLIEDWLSEVYDVTVALDGKTAVQKAVWHQPQVILLDVVLPDMSGYDVVRLLQGAAQTRGIPVIVMTAKNFDDSTIKMIKLENNVFGFLNKPFKPSDLIKMLEVVLKGGRSFLPEVGAAPAPVLPSPGKAQEPLPNAGADVVKDVSGPVEDSFPPSRATEELVLSSEPIGLVAESRADSGESPDRVSPKVRKKDGPARETGEGTPSPEPPGNLKRIFLGCLVIFFILGLVLGVGEWTCRQVERDLGRRYFTPPLFPATSYNAFMPYQWNNPENTKPTVWNDGEVVFSFNQWGLRGADFPLVASSGVRRILLVGGTSTFGPGVPESETLARRLETLLNVGRPGTFQVINGGLWALSPKEQWAFVKGQGFNFKPEMILWLCEGRLPGAPSTEGVRWLAGRRWLTNPPFGSSRFLQMLVQNKIQGKGDPVPKRGDPLFLEAEKMAKEQKVAFHYWILQQGNLGIFEWKGVGPTVGDVPLGSNGSILDRLIRAVDKKT